MRSNSTANCLDRKAYHRPVIEDQDGRVLSQGDAGDMINPG